MMFFIIVISVSICMMRIDRVIILMMLFAGQGVVETLFAPERHDHHARHIDRGQNCGNRGYAPENLFTWKSEPAGKVIVCRKCLIQDLVFREEARKDRYSADRQ